MEKFYVVFALVWKKSVERGHRFEGQAPKSSGESTSNSEKTISGKTLWVLDYSHPKFFNSVQEGVGQLS